MLTKRLVLWSFAALLIGVRTGFAQLAPIDTPDPGMVFDAFDRAAFSGYGSMGPTNKGPVIRHWGSPALSVVYFGAHNRTWAPMLATYSEVLNAHPKLNVKFLKSFSIGETIYGLDGGQAGLSIYEGSDKELSDIFLQRGFPPSLLKEFFNTPTKACASYMKNPVWGSEAVVLIRSKAPAPQQAQCIGNGLMFAIGLDVSKQPHGVFFERKGSNVRLTKVGSTVIDVLYDENIHPDMQQEQALPIAKQILRRLLNAPTY